MIGASLVLGRWSLELRERRPSSCRDDETDTDRYQKKRKELATGDSEYERRIGFTKIFDDNPESRVADKKQAG